MQGLHLSCWRWLGRGRPSMYIYIPLHAVAIHALAVCYESSHLTAHNSASCTTPGLTHLINHMMASPLYHLASIPTNLTSSLLQALAIVTATLLIRHLARPRHIGNSKGLPLPPGPKPLPVIGNASDIPTTMIGQRFREMNEKYGTLIVYCSAVN